MLTHELERPENLNTYLTRALAPVRPLYTFGRSWGADPQIPRDQAIWDFWKETGMSCSNIQHRCKRLRVRILPCEAQRFEAAYD